MRKYQSTTLTFCNLMKFLKLSTAVKKLSALTLGSIFVALPSIAMAGGLYSKATENKILLGGSGFEMNPDNSLHKEEHGSFDSAVSIFTRLETFDQNTSNRISVLPFKKLTKAAKNSINQYWTVQMANSGRSYTSPKLYSYHPDNLPETPCGSAVANNAFYCPVNNNIYFDRVFLKSQYDQVGDYAVVHILAHEWGHLVQNQMGINRSNNYSIQLELQADCFAGAYARFANYAGYLEDGDLLASLKAAQAGGDQDTPWFDPNAHGTSSQRIRAIVDGWNGPGACFSYRR